MSMGSGEVDLSGIDSTICSSPLLALRVDAKNVTPVDPDLPTQQRLLSKTDGIIHEEQFHNDRETLPAVFRVLASRPRHPHGRRSTASESRITG